tara:strand:+ start:504 stop:683 length:180 start_codon:yes stop_codon:yes gene_type:complete
MKTEYINRKYTGGGSHFVNVSMSHKTRQALEELAGDKPISSLIEKWIREKVKEHNKNGK